MKEVWIALKTAAAAKQPAVLATIVAVEGSVYRQAGARAFIGQDGTIIGIVSGGCVEKDLAVYAEEVLADGEARFVDYDFRSEDDLIWGMGLGCNGALRLWLQPFDPVKDPDAAQVLLRDWERRMTTDEPYWQATLVEAGDSGEAAGGEARDPGKVAEGRHAADSGPVTAVGTLCFEEDFAVNGLETVAGLQTVRADVADSPRAGEQTWYVEHIQPRPHLMVFGAGADAVPLTRSAAFVEWRITVIDHRPDWAAASNFPHVDNFQVISRKAYGSVPIPRGALVVTMTHQYDLDSAALRNAVGSQAAYVGALGPRRRFEQMLEEWREQGTEVTPTQLARVYSPVGLDIGSESPEEIAASIVTEALAVLRSRKGEHLRERAQAGRSIHEG